MTYPWNVVAAGYEDFVKQASVTISCCLCTTVLPTGPVIARGAAPAATVKRFFAVSHMNRFMQPHAAEMGARDRTTRVKRALRHRARIHGDASRSSKRRFRARPSGVSLSTGRDAGRDCTCSSAEVNAYVQNPDMRDEMSAVRPKCMPLRRHCPALNVVCHKPVFACLSQRRLRLN